MTTVSFPGLGIGEFTMSEVAFSIDFFGLLKNPIEIRWYGLLITIGIVLAILYALKRTKDEGISADDLLDMGIFTIIFGIIGARTYYVLTYGISNFVVKDSEGSLKLWDTFVSIIGIWNGGIAIYGALIAGGLTIYLVCRHKKINFLKAFDAISPAVMIGQILGRWGNFVNGEAYGYEVKAGDFLYTFRMGLIPNIESATKIHFFHPTFLYESLWNLIGFLLINWLYKKKKFDGQVFLMYATWYGFGRMFIEGLRTDSLYIGVFRISQIVGFCCFIGGAVLLFLGFKKAKKVALESADYEPVYKSFVKKSTSVNVARRGEDVADSSRETSTDKSESKSDSITEGKSESPENAGIQKSGNDAASPEENVPAAQVEDNGDTDNNAQREKDQNQNDE